jgi:hypothetical protein
MVTQMAKSGKNHNCSASTSLTEGWRTLPWGLGRWSGTFVLEASMPDRPDPSDPTDAEGRRWSRVFRPRQASADRRSGRGGLCLRRSSTLCAQGAQGACSHATSRRGQRFAPPLTRRRKDGTLRCMHDRLRERARKPEGRAREPLAAVVEAQTEHG